MKTDPASASQTRKPSVFKVIGVYCLVWAALAVLFIAYVAVAPNHGGIGQRTANFVAMLAGMAFVGGLVLVLALKGGVYLTSRAHKEKSYYDELSK